MKKIDNVKKMVGFSKHAFSAQLQKKKTFLEPLKSYLIIVMQIWDIIELVVHLQLASLIECHKKLVVDQTRF